MSRSVYLREPVLVPWLFIFMINDLEVSNNSSFYMWKFADDTIVSESVFLAQQSHRREGVDDIYHWSPENCLQLRNSFHASRELSALMTRSTLMGLSLREFPLRDSWDNS